MSKKTVIILVSVFAANILLIGLLIIFFVGGIKGNNSDDDIYINSGNSTASEEIFYPSLEDDKLSADASLNSSSNNQDNNAGNQTGTNQSSSNNTVTKPSTGGSSAGTSVVGGTNSESEGGTIVNSDPDAIPVLPHYSNLKYGKKGDKIPGTDITITDPEIAMEFEYYHRVQNYMYYKYKDKFKIYSGFYSGDDSGDQWTCQFYYRDNPKIRVIAMMAKYADGTFYCYDDVDFSMVQYEIREVFTPKAESMYGDDLGFISVDVNDAIGTGGFCEVDEVFSGTFKTYKTLKQAFESQGKEVRISIHLNFNKTFEQMGDKSKVLSDLYSIIKLGKDKKYTPINYKFDFSNGDNGQTIIEINSYDVDSITSAAALEKFIVIW